MGRNLTAAVKTESKKGNIRPALLAYLALDGGDIRVTSLDHDVVWGGDTYVGVGNMGRVSAITESTMLQASGLKLELSGIPAAYISMVLNEDYNERDVTLWTAFLDSSYAIIADPVLQFKGKIDQMGINLGATATVTLTAENKLIAWDRPNERRYTNADQQERFPLDKGLEFISQMVEKEIVWGRATP